MDLRGHPVKISMIGPVYPYRGGIAHYVTSLYHALADQHEVKVTSFKRQYPSFLYPGRSDRDPSVEAIKVEADFHLDPLNPLSWYRSADEILDWRPDLVILNWWVPFWAIAFGVIGRRLKNEGVPLVIIEHNVLPHERKVWDKPLAKFTLGLGDLHVVHTDRQERLLRSLTSKGKTLLAPLPIYEPIQMEKLTREEARSRLDLPGEQFIFLFFGMVRKYKGLHVLLEALSHLKEWGHLPHLIVAGEFWGKKEGYLQLIQDSSISDQIHIFDEYVPNEELATFYSAANAFVAPYLGGTQSGPLTLALGFGLPSICTPGIASAIDYAGQNALIVVPENDPQALAREMRRLLTMPDQEYPILTGDKASWARLADEILSTIVEEFKQS